MEFNEEPWADKRNKTGKANSLLHLLWEWRPFSADCWHSRKCGYHSEGMHSYCEGPKGTPWRDFSRISVELSLLGKKKSLWVDKWWGNKKELDTLRIICGYALNMVGVWHWAFVTRRGPCTFTSPLFRRMVVLLKSKISWMKNISSGFGWDQALLIQYLEPRKVS